jgi:acylphosphatase
MSELVCLRFIVSGKVQGVFFRASTARQAIRLGVRGHALNRPDGCVEVLALGPAPAVEELRQWLHRGPPSARVEQVQAQPEAAAAHAHLEDFRTC